MVDVARNIATDTGVPDPAIVDDEGPQPAAFRIALFATQALGTRDQLALVLHDPRTLLDRARGIDAPPGDAGPAADELRHQRHEPERTTCRNTASPDSAREAASVYFSEGSSTVSMTWITPLLVLMSAFTTLAPLIMTPLVVLIVSMSPLTALADVIFTTSAAMTLPATT